MENHKEVEVISSQKKAKKKSPFWVTITIAEGLGREQLLSATLHEIIFHVISLIFLSIYVFSRTNPSKFYLTEAIKSRFRVEDALLEVRDAKAVWKYLNEDVIEGFYENTMSGNDSEATSTIHSGESQHNITIYEENTVIGVPRLRQVKVTNISCEIHGYFRQLFSSCYSKFGYSAEDKEDFGLATPTAWTYTDADKTKSVRYWGTLTSYSGGGYYVDFSRDKTKTVDILKELKDNLWVTRGTRAVFIDFTVYNSNLNIFCINKLIFEFMPTGGIQASYRISPVILTPYISTWKFVLRIFLYIFGIYIIYTLCEEIREMCYFGKGYFLQFWNYIDISTIMLTLTVIAGTEYMRSTIHKYIKKIEDDPNTYGNLEEPFTIHQVIKVGEATLLFFVYLRTFKYLNFNRRMAQLNDTIRNCIKDVLGFSVMFFVAYFAYAELGYLLFGTQVDDFRSFGQSMFTLLRTILGDSDYSKIQEANWLVAPIYFLSYIILVFFILLNMFLAIINDTYSDVKTNIAIAPTEMQMTDYLVLKYHNLIRKLGCKVNQEKQKPKIIDTTVSQIRDTLVKCNFDDREIEMYFKRYEINPLKELNKKDLDAFYEIFAQEELARQRGDDKVVSWKDFQKQDDKLVELENSLVVLGQKVQDLIRAIEGIQSHNKELKL